VTLGGRACSGARCFPPAARRDRQVARRRRPTVVLVVRGDGGSGPGAVPGVPIAASLSARRAMPALRAAGAMRAALSGRRVAFGAGVGPGRVRRAGARPCPRAEVPRRARRCRCDGGTGRCRRAGRAARSAGGARPGAHPPAEKAGARFRSRRSPGRGRRGADGPRGVAMPGARGSADAPGWIVAFGPSRARADRRPRAGRTTPRGRPHRRCSHDRRDLRGVRR
jgi:hypothetical protein